MEATVESPQIEPQKPAHIPLFNKENAKQMAALGLAKRQENKIKREQAVIDRLAQLRLEAEKPKADPVIVERQAQDDYRAKELKITRAQIRHVNTLIAESISADEISKLSTAKQKLYDIESRLSGRANPGTLKPTTKQDRQPDQPFGPLDDQ